VRYDTRAPFATQTSWEVFDASKIAKGAGGYQSALFDGRYVYLVPSLTTAGFGQGVVVRYDTQGVFTSAGAWASFDTKSLNPHAEGYWGGAFDGRYLYFAPYWGQTAIVTRYDTQAPFGAAASWSFFAAQTVNPNVGGFSGAGFDGRYVYFAPSLDQAGNANGLVLRYDTKAAFGDKTSWQAFDMQKLINSADNYFGVVFDGQYVTFVPDSTGVFVRYRARTTPKMPKLPAFHGSFF